MAGFHTLQGTGPDTLTERTYKSLLQPGQHKIIGFALRTQGLMVAKGNPLRLGSLSDIAGHHARFANRALGTGTRVVHRRPVPQRLTAVSRAFAPLFLGGSDGHADELEAGMAQTVARLKAAAEA